jgi:hypothetical protein
LVAGWSELLIFDDPVFSVFCSLLGSNALHEAFPVTSSLPLFARQKFKEP